MLADPWVVFVTPAQGRTLGQGGGRGFEQVRPEMSLSFDVSADVGVHLPFER